MRRTWPALLLMLSVAVTLGWLSLGAGAANVWVVYAAWGAFAVALAVRIIVGVARRRTAAAPHTSNVGAVGVVEAPARRAEGRSDLEPVVHGPDTSPITMLPPEARNPFEQQLGRLERGDERRP